MRCVHEKHFATCPECNGGEFKSACDDAATAYRDEDFKNNPDGYTVAPYVNDATTAMAFEAGAIWSRRYMLESDPAISMLVEALRYAKLQLADHGQSDPKVNRALAAFANERGEL